MVYQMNVNEWQYGKWRFAECVPVHRDKSPKRSTMPDLQLSPPFAILRVELTSGSRLVSMNLLPLVKCKGKCSSLVFYLTIKI